jgi:hypothetical protein
VTVETNYSSGGFLIMNRNSPSAVITQAEHELEETRGLVEQQFRIVKRLKRLGTDTKDAICFLIDLLELQERRIFCTFARNKCVFSHIASPEQTNMRRAGHKARPPRWAALRRISD